MDQRERDAADAGRRPLVVDLDGTLIASDMLWESALQVGRATPWGLLRLWVHYRGERGAIKAALADRALVRPECLPWNEAVLELLRTARAEGRPIWLATASDERTAQTIADHLGLFDRVMGSRPGYNCKAWRKRERIEAAAGPGGYDYIGDSRADLPVFAGAHRAWVVGAGAPRLRAAAYRDGPVPEILGPVAGRLERAGVIVRMARPSQWAANLLIFAPLLATGRWSDPGALARTLGVFVAVCLVVSAAGIINDLFDVERHRRHPRKRFRPIAAGEVVPGRAVWSVIVLLLAGLLLGMLAGAAIFVLVLGSFVLGLLHSRRLKRHWWAGMPALAALYALRIWAGALAAGVR